MEKIETYIQKKLFEFFNIKFYDWTLIDNKNFEEGFFIFIFKEDIKKIIGIVPTKSRSIYNDGEKFRIQDFTNKKDHFIHKYFIIKLDPIVCFDDMGGSIFLLDFKDNNYFSINKFINLEKKDKLQMLDNYEINFQSFLDYNLKNPDNLTYSKLIDTTTIITYLQDL